MSDLARYLDSIHFAPKLNQFLPLTALFADAARQMSGYLAPGLRAILLDTLHEDAVFFLGPGTLDHFRVEDFLPPVQALDIGAIV